jgi:transitional endoplasmic reticulum ATPase
MIMPTVDIPEHLQDNLLLKVIKHQIKILHSEMDNSKDDEGKKKEKGNSKGTKRIIRATD